MSRISPDAKRPFKRKNDKYVDKAEAARMFRRQCLGKTKYKNEYHALFEIPETQRVYECPRCHFWHRATIGK